MSELKTFENYESIEAYIADHKTFSDYHVGETFEKLGRTVTQADIRMFVGATDATHPVHVNQEYANQHPLIDDIVAHGVLTLSLSDAFVIEFSREAAFGLNYGYERVRFPAPVYVNDTISGTIEVVGKSDLDDEWGILDLDIELVNQGGSPVLVAENKLLLVKETANMADLESD